MKSMLKVQSHLSSVLFASSMVMVTELKYAETYVDYSLYCGFLQICFWQFSFAKKKHINGHDWYRLSLTIFFLFFLSSNFCHPSSLPLQWGMNARWGVPRKRRWPLVDTLHSPPWLVLDQLHQSFSCSIKTQKTLTTNRSTISHPRIG